MKQLSEHNPMTAMEAINPNSVPIEVKRLYPQFKPFLKKDGILMKNVRLFDCYVWENLHRLLRSQSRLQAMNRSSDLQHFLQILQSNHSNSPERDELDRLVALVHTFQSTLLNH